MKISKETFEVMMNMAQIQNGIVVDEPQCLKTMSPTGSIISVYDTEETFPLFAIWDFTKFNSTINVHGIVECEFTFNNQESFVEISAGSRKVNYEYADAGSMPTFEQIKNSRDYKAFDKFDFTFKILADEIKDLKKMNQIFNFTNDVLKIDMVDGVGTIKIYSASNETKSDYIIEIDGEGTGSAMTKVDDMIMISDDYTASVCEKMIKYQSDKKPLMYFIKNFLEER